MTALTLIKSHCGRVGLPRPGSVIGSSDASVVQMLELLNDTISIIVDFRSFQAIRRETAFTFIVGADQGLLTTLTSDEGFLGIVAGTFWDRTNDVPIGGPLTPQMWQERQANDITGPYTDFYIRERKLFLSPAPTASTLYSAAFEYLSSSLVLSSSSVAKNSVTADDDTFAIPENIVSIGLSARWKREKGLPYEVDEDDFLTRLGNYYLRQSPEKAIDLSCTPPEAKPGILVPAGNWSL